MHKTVRLKGANDCFELESLEQESTPELVMKLAPTRQQTITETFLSPRKPSRRFRTVTASVCLRMDLAYLKGNVDPGCTRINNYAQHDGGQVSRG